MFAHIEDGFFIINTPETLLRGSVTFNNGGHVCFKAPSLDSVNAFYKAGIELGASDGGAPGVRQHYADDYYAAYIYDYDGHKLEVMARKLCE